MVEDETSAASTDFGKERPSCRSVYAVLPTFHPLTTNEEECLEHMGWFRAQQRCADCNSFAIVHISKLTRELPTALWTRAMAPILPLGFSGAPSTQPRAVSVLRGSIWYTRSTYVRKHMQSGGLGVSSDDDFLRLAQRVAHLCQYPVFVELWSAPN